jgi:hypothetical protein
MRSLGLPFVVLFAMSIPLTLTAQTGGNGSFTGGHALDHPIFDMGKRVMVAERLRDGERVTLDGRLDEAFWQRAAPATDFIMQEPTLGGTPTERTEVRIVYDEDNLYMGVTNYDSEPHRLMGNTMKRDEFLSADDRFMWTIDTFLDQQTGYFFEMNPSGLMADAVMGATGMNREWDGIWDARARRSEIGWTLEIVIPFRTLNFDPNAPAWGINFQRTVRRKNEESLWTGHERNQGLWRMTNAGLLVGIRDVSQGRGLDIRPYAVARAAEAPGRVPASGRVSDVDVGLDLIYNLTPTLRANLTVNTDFAETEVDQRQLNLTRFPLFFPEKRGFFIEGATFFDFHAPPDIRPFFSRRIGLDRDGVPQPIDGGMKLTGQAGRQDVGALVVRTAASGAVDAENFAVFRMRRRLLTQSYVGGIYTLRQGAASGAGEHHTAGLDFRLRTNRFRGSQNLEFGAMALATPTPTSSGDNLAFAARLAYPNDRWNAGVTAVEVQPNHDLAVGFLRRRAYRGYYPSLTFSPRPDGHPLVRRLSFGGDLSLLTDLGNRTLTRELALTMLRVETHSGDNVTLTATPTHERLERDFPIFHGVTLPGPAEYDFTRYRVGVGTANRRIVAVQTGYTFGSFFSGERREAALQVGLRPRPGVTLVMAGERNDVDLPEGSFRADLFRFVADTQLNPRVYLVNNLQYDSFSRQIGWQGRFRWIVRPGNDLFFVYTHNWFEELGAEGFSTLDRRGATKINFSRRI